MVKNIFFILIITIISAFCNQGLAQDTDQRVYNYVKLIEKGEIERVTVESEKLISDNPNHPGILYLRGKLSTDGLESLKLYQGILDNYPKSEWADDALYHTYQYYYAVGLYKTAELKMLRLKKEYPNSPYLNINDSTENQKTFDDEFTLTDNVRQDTMEIPINDNKLPDTVKSEPPVIKLESGNDYTIQVGAFSTQQNAEKQKYFFHEKRFQTEIVKRVRSGRELFLVWVGNFTSTEEATKTAVEINRKYKIETIIVQKY